MNASRPQTLAARTIAHRRRLAAQSLRKRGLLDEAARLAALLELRESAYRRLLTFNGKLEADRRAAEAIAAAVHAYRSEYHGVGSELADLRRLLTTITEHIGYRDLDHQFLDVNADDDGPEVDAR